MFGSKEKEMQGMSRAGASKPGSTCALTKVTTPPLHAYVIFFDKLSDKLLFVGLLSIQSVPIGNSAFQGADFVAVCVTDAFSKIRENYPFFNGHPVAGKDI